MSVAELELRNVAVGYGGVPLLRNLSLTVRRGEVISLIGPNGAGKSTIIKAIIRQLRLLGGCAVLEGKAVSSYSSHELARRMSVLLTHGVHPEMLTCWDVVAAGRYPHTGRLGVLAPADKAAVWNALASVQAQDLADRLFSAVSDGQRQRVMLARALCQQPQVLVLDEPTAYLDVRYRLEALALVRRLANSGMAVIMSLQEVELAQRVSDRIVCVGADGCRVVFPDELAQGSLLTGLYGIADHAYDALLGCVEFPRVEGVPRVFVISSGGTGIPVFRRLQREGVPFAAGILYTNDIDYRVASRLAVDVVAAEPFLPLADAPVAKARALIDGCVRVINAGIPIGVCNRRMEEILSYAGGKLCQEA